MSPWLPLPNGSGQIPLNPGRLAGLYTNYATGCQDAHGGIMFWEYMDHGSSQGPGHVYHQPLPAGYINLFGVAVINPSGHVVLER